MQKARGRLTDQDRADWANFAGRVQALPGRTPAVPMAAAAEERAARLPRSRATALPRKTDPSSTLSVGQQPPGLDSATWRRFRSGRLPSARTLDLHGSSAQRAYTVFVRFLLAAHADRVRCVEVITGRGSGESSGVLRRELPLWLNLPELRPLVLGMSHPHRANPGAVRILLKRPR